MGNMASLQSTITPLGDKVYTHGYNPTACTLAAGSVVCLDKDDLDGVDLTLPTALEGQLLHGVLEEAVATLKSTPKIVRRGIVDALVDGGTIDVAVGDVLVPTATGTLVSGVEKEKVKLTDLRVWDAIQTIIGTAANDDLGITTGTYLTGAPYVGSGDSKAAVTARYARFLVPVTRHLVNSLTVRINAGMVTTVSDGTAALDLFCVRQAAPSTEICATAAQSINSLTAANIDFVITPTNIVKGDVLDFRVLISITDTATGTAVIGAINSIELIWGSGLDNKQHAQFIALEANTGAAALKAVYVNI